MGLAFWCCNCRALVLFEQDLATVLPRSWRNQACPVAADTPLGRAQLVAQHATPVTRGMKLCWSVSRLTGTASTCGLRPRHEGTGVASGTLAEQAPLVAAALVRELGLALPGTTLSNTQRSPKGIRVEAQLACGSPGVRS